MEATPINHGSKGSVGGWVTGVGGFGFGVGGGWGACANASASVLLFTTVGGGSVGSHT